MRLFVLQDKNGDCVYRTKERVDIQIIENQDMVCFNEKEYFCEVEKINKSIEKQNIERFNKIKNKLEKDFFNVENVSLNFKSDKLILNRNSMINFKTETLNVDLKVKDVADKIYVKCFDVDKYRDAINNEIQEKDVDGTNLYNLDEEEIRGLLNAPAYICHLVDQKIVSLEEINFNILKCLKDILPISENQINVLQSISLDDITTIYELVDVNTDINNVYFDKGFYTIENNPVVEITIHNGEGKTFCFGEYTNIRDIFNVIENIMNYTSNIILNKGFETEKETVLNKSI